MTRPSPVLLRRFPAYTMGCWSTAIPISRAIAAIVLALPLCSGFTSAADDRPDQSVDFTRDVWPVLQRACIECHGPQKAEGDLRLDQRESSLRSGDEALIRPGQADDSELIRRVTLPRGHDEIMPARGEPLSSAEVQILRDWIDQGATWPDSASNATHWAYVPPHRPAVPTPHSANRVRNPVDAFILRRLERERLQPSPEADRTTLMRRLSLDLIGLPPTPEEVDAYVNDQRPDADEALVDRLLASEQFGVRWARPWLDGAHYADSHGFQRDDLRDLWPYRDWVVAALNADMPFDQFTIEQLAGDLLPDATVAQRIATGFARCAPCNVEAGSEPEETRVNQVFDRVNTIGMVWLGTTLECCQCHDHKYDPFTMRDYYGLFAFFNNTEIEADRNDPQVPGSIKFLGPELDLSDPGLQAARREVREKVADLEQQRSQREDELRTPDPDWEAAQLKSSSDPADDKPIPAGVRAVLDTPVDERTPAQARTLLKHRQKADERYQQLTDQLALLEKELKALKGPATLVMQETTESRPSTLFTRGDYRTPGDPIAPATPALLPPFASAADPPPQTRLELARWLVSPDNPLTARVVVNRLWAELFGQGLVTTPEDFGTRGDRPTHPELLDWLAVEFVEHGWSMKHVIRTIVLSSTYRQSSRVTPELLARDDRNRLYARGPRVRLSAEMIRDNALAIAGLLSLKQGGVPIRPWQPDGLWTKVGGEKYDYQVSPGEDRYRRGLYVVWKRSAPYPSFVNFDADNRMACRVKRPRSNTPLQALTLMNDPVYVEAAMAFARRVLTERPHATPEDRIAHAFRLAVARAPRPEETTALHALFDAQLAAARDDAASTQEFVKGFDVLDGASPEEFAAWYAVAAALLNLDETITKG